MLDEPSDLFQRTLDMLILASILSMGRVNSKRRVASFFDPFDLLFPKIGTLSK